MAALKRADLMTLAEAVGPKTYEVRDPAHGAYRGSEDDLSEPRRVSGFRRIVLARVSADGGVTRGEILRELEPLVAHKLSPGEWRTCAEFELDALVDAHLINHARNRFTTTSAGQYAADHDLGKTASKPLSWPDLRDTFLVASALGLFELTPANLRGLKKPEGLRALIVQQAFDLPLKAGQPAAQLRTALAEIALSRAFGNKIKTDVGGANGLSAKASRMLAGQLCRHTKDFVTDGKLIATLAAQIADARQTDFEELQAAVLRRFATELLVGAHGVVMPPSIAAGEASDAKNGVRGAQEIADEKPNLADFATAVQNAARKCAEGWSGNRKAFISQTWQVIRVAHAAWGISEIEFKCMLAEAHRAGHLALATADLKNKACIGDIEASAITYKNTVWHLVRVSDAGAQ